MTADKRIDIELRPRGEGVAPETVMDDFVGRVAIRTHLNGCLDIGTNWDAALGRSSAAMFATDTPISCPMLASPMFANARYFECTFGILGDNS